MYTVFLIASIGIFLGQQLIFAMLIASKTTKEPKYRRFGAILLVCFSLYQIYLQQYFFSSLLAHCLSMCLVPLTCFSLIHYLLFTRAVDAAVPPDLTSLPWSAWRRSFVQVLRDLRGVRSQPVNDVKGAEFNQARFLRDRAAQYARNTATAELLWFVLRHIFVPRTPDWELCFGRGKEFLLLEATDRQLLARAYSSISIWIGLYCVLDTFNCLLLVGSVVLGDCKPHDWPPPFGSLKGAFSLRRFWGSFWHHLLRRPLIDCSKAIMTKIPKSWGKVYNAVYTCLPFLLSGLFHSPTDFLMWFNGAIDWPLVLPFFCKTIVAIKLEVMVISWYHSYRHRLGLLGKNTRPFERALGYTWVVIFISYATPPASYPLIRYLGAQNNRSLYWEVP